MASITWEKKDKIGIIRMNNGENRHNLDFANSMNQVIDEVISNTEITSLIITSGSEKYWSLGVDVDWVGSMLAQKKNDKVKAFMYAMNQVFSKILLYPVPVIAALNGHTFGNGAILACACDFRMMRKDRGFFCFPEVDLGIPFLPGMVKIVSKAIPNAKLYELKLTGKRATADELEKAGVVLKASENAASLMEDAIGFASGLQKKRGIFSELKKRMHKPVIEAIEKEDPAYIESLSLFIPD